MGRIKARPRVPDPALIWIDGAGLDRPPRRLGPKRRDPHDGLRVDAVLAEAQVGAGDRVRGPGSAHPDPELVDARHQEADAVRVGGVLEEELHHWDELPGLRG